MTFLYQCRFGFMLLAFAGLLSSCRSVAHSQSVAASSQADGPQGTLEFRANGEDFVRQGFTSKDGWQIEFDHVYVTLKDLTAHAAETTVSIADPQTVDLAAGDENAETRLIEAIETPATHFQSLAWSLVPALDGPAAGQALQLEGQAQKDGQTIAFNISWDRAYSYQCGDFIGDERKGIVKPGKTADVEATFHFDHLFGDGDAPAEDDINLGALGFDPLVALATDSQLSVDRAELEAQLSANELETLEKVFYGLGHVGEGHCETTAE